MAKPKLLILLIPTFVVLSSCASSSKFGANNKLSDEYVYILDHKKISAIEMATLRSGGNIRTVWVNPPVKKIKKSQLPKID